jgi:4-hydroxybenzoate polyprenyltransferase
VAGEPTAQHPSWRYPFGTTDQGYNVFSQVVYGGRISLLVAGVAAVIALLAYEHAIVRPSDLSRLDVAFFNLNGYVSVAFFVATLVDALAR